MADVFISYSSEDRSWVSTLSARLEKEGFSVWWDRKIPVGKSFHAVIEEAIDQARCVVVVWSPVSVKSDWVCNEAEEGMRRSVLVPVVLNGAKIPIGFRHLQAANLTDWKAAENGIEFASLMGALSRLVPRSSGLVNGRLQLRSGPLVIPHPKLPRQLLHDRVSQELLGRSVTMANLSEYSEIVMPEKFVSEPVQKLVLDNLDVRTYPSIACIDDAVRATWKAVVVQMHRDPAKYFTSTSVIELAIGFADVAFRKRHPFGSSAKEAFAAYAGRPFERPP